MMERRDTENASTPPSIDVIEAVAEEDDAGAGDLPPLSEAIDPDALDDLFGPALNGEPRQGREMIFGYFGYTVRVQADGGVTVDE